MKPSSTESASTLRQGGEKKKSERTATSFNTTLTHLVCKPVPGHVLLLLLLISSYQNTFRQLLGTLVAHTSSITTDTHSRMEGEQDNRTAKVYTTHQHGKTNHRNSR